MHDLRADTVRQHPFYTRAGHDTQVVTLSRKEDQHTCVLPFLTDAPSLEKLVGEIECILLADGL